MYNTLGFGVRKCTTREAVVLKRLQRFGHTAKEEERKNRGFKWKKRKLCVKNREGQFCMRVRSCAASVWGAVAKKCEEEVKIAIIEVRVR